MLKQQVTPKQLDFQAFSTLEGIYALDQQFLDGLLIKEPDIYQALLAFRQGGKLTAKMESAFIVALAPQLEEFISQVFSIEHEVLCMQAKVQAHQPVWAFKQFYVLKKAKRLLHKASDYADFDSHNKWLMSLFKDIPYDVELAVAKLAQSWLQSPVEHEVAIEKLIAWCVSAMSTASGQAFTQTWSSFKLPEKLDFAHLVKTEQADDGGLQAATPLRFRDGFELSAQRLTPRAVMSEIEYCVYCHKNDGDFCSKGFPVKKSQPELGLKRDPLGDLLTGCPLEEKISEMNMLKRQGYGIAALATVMIDNPMCPLTGHRICNDCMKACIYQKQDPVDIPQVETSILTEVLDLPWGVEIYDLLTRWNPLRQKQYVPKPYNGHKILVMGMGPAGITLAHHLLMEGFAVVGMDGLKIEPLESAYINRPIKDFATIKQSLEHRLMAGFGGVAEYGITVRWDKNFLKLLHINLSRRQYFQLVGGVRFGGTLKVENAWNLGFDHLALAVGAGLPKELAIENSMVPGMRQANDFLMALQLTGAAKSDSLASLQVRLPAVVIGGGLTGVDTATEVQAYYLAQIEKMYQRYVTLVRIRGEAVIRSQFSDQELGVLDEWLAHAKQLQQERGKALQQGRSPDLIGLIRQWGGVHIIYRKRMQASPAYRLNHEELQQALAEGIFYKECLQPIAVVIDEYGDAKGLRCKRTVCDADGHYDLLAEEELLEAATILVATGAKPNVAYEFEYKGTFARKKFEYHTFKVAEDDLLPVPRAEHVKAEEIGVFTSYKQDNKRVSFIGDTHPVFHGSVVKAMASAKYAYPRITEQVLALENERDTSDFSFFNNNLKDQFNAVVHSIRRLTSHVLELKIKAPLAWENSSAGQFFRLQTFESNALTLDNTRIYASALALVAIKQPDEPHVLTFIVEENDVASCLVKYLKPGDQVALMGPTGSCGKTIANSTVLFVGGIKALLQLLTFGYEMQQKNVRIVYLAYIETKDDLLYISELYDLCESIYYVNPNGFELPLKAQAHTHWTCDVVEAVERYVSQSDVNVPLNQLDQVYVAGKACLIKKLQKLRAQGVFSQQTQFIASVMGPMQCMLKGVCAQCLQWQVDPQTGARTKAVYACSWQNQPMDMIDLDHMEQRRQQNKLQDRLNLLWLDYVMQKKQLPHV